MSPITSAATCTFAVDDVTPAEALLPTCPTQEAVEARLGTVEACCDYRDDCVRKVPCHPLIAAVHLAFSEHRPLVLSPDMIWVAILQGFAEHVKQNAERFRHRFVGHAGKKKLRVRRDDLARRSPENPWREVIHAFSERLQAELGPLYEGLVADFSTTGPVERAACEVALLDTFQPYFQYECLCICGIPHITLEGTADDWQRLRAKIEQLAPYDLDWWLPDLRAIADQFVRAAQGDVDREHWRNIYKRYDAYGGEIMNGWIIRLLPYVEGGNRSGSARPRNPYLSNEKYAAVRAGDLPSGISRAPFVCVWAQQEPAQTQALEFLGGFLGVTQDAATKALRPKLGWAVRASAPLEQFLVRLPTTASAPLAVPAFDAQIAALARQCWAICEQARQSPERTTSPECQFPPDLLAFYKECNGCVLAEGQAEIRPLERLEPMLGVQSQRPAKQAHYWDHGAWLRFCDFADGTFAVIELYEYWDRRARLHGFKVVHCDPRRADAQGRLPILAWSCTDFLQKLVAAGGCGERIAALSFG